MNRLKLNNHHYGYVIVVCCCLIIMGVDIGLAMSCAGIFYQPVSTELGISVGEFGLYMSFNYLASTLMLSIAGKLMECISARVLLTLSSAGLGIVLIAMACLNSAWQFYVAGSFIGIMLAFLLYLSFPTMINRWFKTQVGFFIGICSAASGIGGVLFNPIGAYLINIYGWRMTYAIFGAVILFAITPILRIFLRNYPKDKGLSAYGQENIQKIVNTNNDCIEYSRAIKLPVFYSIICFAFLMISVSTLNLFIPNYITELKYTLNQASFVASAIMLGVTIGKVALGIINDKNPAVGVITTVVCGIAGLSLLLMGKIGITIVIIGGFLFGWAYAGVTVQTPLLVRAIFGNRSYTHIYSNVSIAFAAGGALTAGGWGILADYMSFAFILYCGIIFLSICGAIGLYSLRVSYSFAK